MGCGSSVHQPKHDMEHAPTHTTTAPLNGSPPSGSTGYAPSTTRHQQATADTPFTAYRSKSIISVGAFGPNGAPQCVVYTGDVDIPSGPPGVWHKFPGPPKFLSLGSVPWLIKHGGAVKASQDLNDTFKSDCVEVYMFKRRSIQINDADLASQIMEESDTYSKRIKGAMKLVKEIGKQGLFTTDTNDPDWASAHRILIPAFSYANMKQYVPILSAEVEKMLKCFDQMEQENSEFLLEEWMTRMAFSAIAAAGFGYDLKMLDSPKSTLNPFINAMNSALGIVITKYQRTDIQNYLDSKTSKEFNDDRELMYKILFTVLAERKEKMAKGEDVPKDMLNYMLTNADPETGTKMSDDIVRDQIITFLVAGHETTSILMTWTLWELSLHPEIEVRVYEEAVRCLGENDIPDFDQVGKLTYLGQVLKEVLRLHSPLRFVGKSCIKNTVFNQCPLKQGDGVAVNIKSLHLNPKFWGKTPGVFNPDNFSPENAKNRNPYAWLPFSVGARACIGLQFALTEARMVIAAVVKKFRVHPRPGYVALSNYAAATDKIVGGLPCSLESRKADPSRPARPKASVAPRPSVSMVSVEGLLGRDIVDVSNALEGPKLVFWFGSQEGLAKDHAERIRKQATSFGILTAIYPLDALCNLDQLGMPDEVPQINVFVSATYNGKPPDNALQFDCWSAKQEEGCLKGRNIRHAVLGMGNTQYVTYQFFPKLIEKRLQSWGSTELVERGECDADTDIEGPFKKWAKKFWNVILKERKEKTAAATDKGSGGASKVSVWFGSSLGCVESLAARFVQQSKKFGFSASMSSMDSLTDVQQLRGTESTTQLNVFITCTYNGKPPDNAKKFDEWLIKLPPNALAGINHAVCGIGNSQWVTFQVYPRHVQNKLCELGSSSFNQIGECDVGNDVNTEFRDWSTAFWIQMTEFFHGEESDLTAILDGNDDSGFECSLTSEPAKDEHPFVRFGTHPELQEAIVTRNTQLSKNERSCVSVGFQLPSVVKYTTGDHLLVQPCNSDEQISALAEKANFTQLLDKALVIKTSDASRAKVYPVGSPITIRDLFKWYLDISAPATSSFLRVLSLVVTDAEEKATLLDMSSLEGADRFASEVSSEKKNVYDVIMASRSCSIGEENVGPFISGWLGHTALKGRYYSISSSPLEPDGAGHCGLTSRVHTNAKFDGSTYYGVCSSYLSRLKQGDKVWIKTKDIGSKFHLPEAPSTPIIMVGAGTGVAPLRGFIQERHQLAKKGGEIGKMALFFGCRDEEEVLYREEMEQQQTEGRLQFHVAFSRSVHSKKTYVQHEVVSQGSAVWQLLQEGAHVYVCGDAKKMAPDVKKAFTDICQKHGGYNETMSSQFMAFLGWTGRYCEDVWAS